jgi:Tfp pilus assembly protein PilF
MATLVMPLFLCACGVPGERIQLPPPGKVQINARLPRGGLFDCGPEVLAALLELNGKPSDVSAVSEEICEKTKGGTNPLAMAAYAARFGLRTRAAPGCTYETLRATLNLGIPAVTMVEFGPLTFHYYLVVGAPAGEIVCADYGGAIRVFSEEEFSKYWNRTHRYTLFLAPDVSHIPYSEDDYLARLKEPPFPADFLDGATHFLVGMDYLERKHVKLAKIEFERALDRDSRQVGAALALGNCYFEENDFQKAADSFRLGAHAGGACANNLAYVLSERLGKPEEAWAFAKAAEAQSVRLSEPWFQSQDTIGTVGYRLGKFDEAEAAWRSGAEAAVQEAQRTYRAGCWAGAARAAMAAGRKADATEWVARAEKDGLDAETLEALRAELKKP